MLQAANCLRTGHHHILKTIVIIFLNTEIHKDNQNNFVSNFHCTSVSTIVTMIFPILAKVVCLIIVSTTKS